MKRGKQKFLGVLTDDELYFLEDVLNFYGDSHSSKEKRRADRLISKLYSDFWEAPKNHKKPDSLVFNYR